MCQIFVLAPSLARERDLFFHARLTIHCGAGTDHPLPGRRCDRMGFKPKGG
jgi:hypothetical protein